MKKIMFAGLKVDFNDDTSGKTYFWDESSEAEYGDDWNGDVRGYINNLDIEEDKPFKFLKNGAGFNIRNLPAGALILGQNKKPAEIYWLETV